MIKNFKIALILLLIIAIVGCAPAEDIQTETEAKKVLEVHYIDVGQGDAILVKTPVGENILIDAGKNSGADDLITYLENQGIESFSAVIGTHPHEDHIGGLDRVIDEFDVQSVYMPKVLHTTKTFEDVLDSIERKNLTIKTAKNDVNIPLNGIDALFVSPIFEEYEELNNYSAVLRLQYEENVFLFTGDAEELAEMEMFNFNESEIGEEYSLKADVLKLGHHGSSTSTSEAFLAKVSPIYGVISCGEDNSYGHPHDEIIDRLEKYNVNVLRTDIDGNIIIKSDGKNIEVLKEGK